MIKLNNYLLPSFINKLFKMRKNLQGSVSPQRSSLSPKKNSSSSHKNLLSDTYFCHFNNAMYMGGIKTFQKNGRGIIVHDSGASVLSSYHYDMRHGHNVIFLENCLMSIEYAKNKVQECLLRVPGYLLLARYSKEGQLDGKSVLMDYDNRNLYYTYFRKGTMVEKKQEKEYSVLNRAFDLQNLEFLIGINHAKALRFEFEPTEHIMCQKIATRLSLGFFKKGLPNGLAFSITTKENSYSTQSQRLDKFCIKPLDRGFYLNSQLTGMGEKWFKNGNYYIGDFKADVFEGRGLLKNSIKNNWVYGSFESGNLKELIDYDNEGDNKKFDKIIEAMHERKNSWINKEIQIEDPALYLKEINKILENNPASKMKSLEERKNEVLRKIQDNFICDSAEESALTSSRNVMNYYKNTNDSPNTVRNNEDDENYNNFSKQFARSQNFHQQPPQNHQQNPYDSPGQERKDYKSGSQFPSRTKNLRKVEVEERKPDLNVFFKLNEVPTTKESSSRQRNDPQSAGRKLDYEFHRSKPSEREKYRESSLSKSKYSHTSAIQKESEPALDSKRLIGRSRLFKYLNNEAAEQEPPRFNYVPNK